MLRIVRIAIALLAICWPRVSAAADLTLAWDPPTDGVTTGYIIYFGTASHAYSQHVDVGNVTIYTVTGLAPGTTYYFVVVAHDADGQQSDPSDEVVGTTDATAVRTNVALGSNGGVASASSTYGPDYAPSGANDGDRRGQPWGHGGGWNDATPDQFPDTLQIQFNGAKTIDEIDVFSVQDNYQAPVDPTVNLTSTLYGLRNFDVEYWTGTAWQAVSGGSVVNNSLVWRRVQFSAVTTTAVRIVISSALSTWSRVTEVEAWTVGSVNQAPTVSLTSPTEGASFLTSDTVSVQAIAGDVGGSIQNVTFFLNGGQVGLPDTSFPYGTPLTGLAAGNYTLTAVATDNLLATTTSVPVHFSVTQPTVRENVALASNGGVASASSTYSAGFAPAGANDGDRRGQSWGSGGGWNDATPNQFPDTLEIQFNGAKTIDEIDLFSVQDNYVAPLDPTASMTFTLYGLRNFDVEYWTGTAWQVVSGGSVVNNSLVWRRVQFSAVTTTAVRIVISSALSTWSRVTEVEAWTVGSVNPAPPVRENVALASNGGLASASTTYSAGYGPAGANNGDRRGQSWGSGGGWNDATPNQFPDTLEIQFNGAKTIDEIDVFSVQDNYVAPLEPTASMTFTLYGLRNFDVQYWTGTAWQTVTGGSIVNNSLVWRQVTFDPVTTTRIRVVVNAALDTWSRVTEVEAWTVATGKEAALALADRPAVWQAMPR